MKKHEAIIIQWKGPYTHEMIEEMEEGNGLYLLGGKLKYERRNWIQYCGITEGTYKNRFYNHHKISQIYRELNIWLGQIIFPKKFSRYYLEIAESIIVYFWQPELNEKKILTLPKPLT